MRNPPLANICWRGAFRIPACLNSIHTLRIKYSSRGESPHSQPLFNAPVTNSSFASSRTSTPIVLDPCTLGRPFHLLDTFHATLRQRIERYLQQRYNQRRGTTLTTTHSGILMARNNAIAGNNAISWGGYGSDLGQIGVGIERRLLLTLLAYHYGDQLERTALDQLPAETQTEQRFATLTQRALLDEILPLLAPEPPALHPQTLKILTPGAPILRVTVHNAALDLSGSIQFVLDDQWLTSLFASAPPRRTYKTKPVNDDTPLSASIPITLTVTMLTKELLLEDILRLTPGDVLPIRLPDAAEVHVKGSRLYHAAVAERAGTLCLTSFKFVE